MNRQTNSIQNEFPFYHLRVQAEIFMPFFYLSIRFVWIKTFFLYLTLTLVAFTATLLVSLFLVKYVIVAGLCHGDWNLVT